MQKTRLLMTLTIVVALLAWACSKSKAPGEWAQLDTGTGDAFYSVNFVDENVGWLNGQTDRSFMPYEENENGNANKNAKPKKPDEKTEDPLKANQGFEVLQTTDGGLTWQQIKDQFKHKIRSVWFVDQQLGWALTIDRDILNTTDGGQNWTLQRKAGTVKLKLFGNRKQPEMDQPEQIDRIYFIDARHGWAWGGGRKDQYAEQPGTFLITVDGGQRWDAVAYPFEQSVSDIFFLDKDHAWASLDGSFYKTGDGGLNWSKIQTKLPEDVFRSLFFLDENNGWVVGRTGRIAKTTDGGRTWVKMYRIKDQYKMRDIFFADRDRGWAVGEGGAILYTPDGGESWLDVSSPTPAGFLDVLFISPTSGWAVGLAGAVLKYQPHDRS